MFIRNFYFSCSQCHKGHRPRSCQHRDRDLYAIKNKGRGSSRRGVHGITPHLPPNFTEAALDAVSASVMENPRWRKMHFHEAPEQMESHTPTKPPARSTPKQKSTPLDIYGGVVPPGRLSKWIEIYNTLQAKFGKKLSATCSAQNPVTSTDVFSSPTELPTYEETNSDALMMNTESPFDFSEISELDLQFFD
jgi:hypothetical protein